MFAHEGPRASNIGATHIYLAAYMEEFKTECQSTGDLQCEIEVLNTSIDKALIGETLAAI